LVSPLGTEFDPVKADGKYGILLHLLSIGTKVILTSRNLATAIVVPDPDEIYLKWEDSFS
jgi:hypothetical protein